MIEEVSWSMVQPLEGAMPFEQVEKSESFALLVGNEGQGVSKDLLSENNEKSYIFRFMEKANR